MNQASFSVGWPDAKIFRMPEDQEKELKG